MTEHQLNTSDRHRRQEAEANAFAIELLAPRSRIRGYLGTPPDLEAVVSMSGDLDISKEAAARRYVECHDETLAVVFSLAGRVVYSDSSSDCPALAVQRGESLPELQRGQEAGSLTAMEDASAQDWLGRARGVEVAVQTLYQREGRAITLVHVLGTDEDTDDGVEDTYSRLGRFNSG